MSDYMQEAERLINEICQLRALQQDAVMANHFDDARGYQEAGHKTRAALLDHIERGRGPEGWKLVPAKATDDLRRAFRQGEDAALLSGHDHYEAFYAGYRAMLAAATAAPSAQCLTCSGHGMIGGFISADSGYHSEPCPECSAPAVTSEVSMPEPAKRTYTNAKNSADVRKGYELSGAVKDEWWDKDQMRTYGAACEDMGYRRGLKSRVPLDAINKMLADCMGVAVANGANSVSMPDHYVEIAAWVCGIKDAAAPAPTDVPMPEPDATLHDDGYFVAKYHIRTSYDFGRAGWRLDVISMAKASTYGDAREAAGYARGRADSLEGGV